MAKWADYGISEVRYNSKHTHIEYVKIREDKDTSFGAAVEYPRTTIIDSIKKGVTFVTIISKTPGNWSKGQPVFIIKINGVEYIKTVDNNKEADNLENLPEY